MIYIYMITYVHIMYIKQTWNMFQTRTHIYNHIYIVDIKQKRNMFQLACLACLCRLSFMIL